MLRFAILVALSLGVACGRAPTPKGSSAPAQVAPTEQAIREDLRLPKAQPADPREPRIAASVTELLEREHVRPHVLDDEISRKAFTKYLEALDPGKLFLLKGEVDVLERDATRIDDQMHAGDLALAHTGAAVMAEEQKKVAGMVAEMLKTPFDFTVEESLETDPKKLSFPANEEERRDRWRKSLKQQVLERIERMDETAKAAEKLKKEGGADKDKGKEPADEEAPKVALEPPPPTFEGREKKAREDLGKDYEGRFLRLSKVEPLEAAETFVNAIAGIYDPHTLYLAPEQQENFDIQISGSLEGIGAVLTEDAHYISVREVVAGGAAWREGQLEAGDLILAVKQAKGEPVDVADMRINEVVRMIRGPKGTMVTLTVKKPDERIVIISIKRDLVVVEDAYARGAILELGPKHTQFGYIYLPSFYGNTRATKGGTPERDATSDVRALLERFAAQDVPGVVIDLRGNGGGLLNHANDITGLLIDRGPVVAAKGAEGKLQVLGDSNPGEAYAGDVVVLVDRFSASASEILAGALQDYGRALIVGTSTHGKGTVQAMVDLDRMEDRRGQGDPLGVAKLTIQQFFLVDGESTQWRGVQPDVALPDPASHVESGERYLENAIPWSSVPPLPATPWPHPSWDSRTLDAKSKTRQDAQPVFGKVRERGAYLLERRKETVVPLKREAWQAQRKKDEESLDALDPKLEDGPERFAVKLINYRPDEPAEPTPARKGGAVRVDKWKETLGHDPWVEEALFLLTDMVGVQKTDKPQVDLAKQPTKPVKK
jgi:carboxyl-terminal processing protease